jgi:hypothetical protein
MGFCVFKEPGFDTMQILCNAVLAFIGYICYWSYMYYEKYEIFEEHFLTYHLIGTFALTILWSLIEINIPTNYELTMLFLIILYITWNYVFFWESASITICNIRFFMCNFIEHILVFGAIWLATYNLDVSEKYLFGLIILEIINTNKYYYHFRYFDIREKRKIGYYCIRNEEIIKKNNKRCFDKNNRFMFFRIKVYEYPDSIKKLPVDIIYHSIYIIPDILAMTLFLLLAPFIKIGLTIYHFIKK